MSDVQIRTFPRLDSMSRAAAEHFASRAVQRVQQTGSFSVAFSGGKTPQAFLKLLATPEFSARIPWESTRMFQVDERCVPPGDPQSNYGMIRESLLSQVPGAAVNFHRMKAEQPDREGASQDYAQVLKQSLAPAGGEAPRFDLIFLGLGPDGHTASLFPRSAALHERQRWVCPNYVEKLQSHRLTLTFPVLNAASEIVFLVSGPDKAYALRQVLESPRFVEEYPAQGVHPEQGRVDWLLDEDAARLLSSAPRGAA